MNRNKEKQRISYLLILLITLLLTGCGKEQRNAVTELSCVQPSNMPELLSPADGKLLMAWNEGNGTELVLADPDEDLIIAREELTGSWLLLDESFYDGGFAVYEWNSLSAMMSRLWQRNSE